MKMSPAGEQADALYSIAVSPSQFTTRAANETWNACASTFSTSRLMGCGSITKSREHAMIPVTTSETIAERIAKFRIERRVLWCCL
jgi:hypothetical protein